MKNKIDQIVAGIRKEVQTAVIGMSGGADSTLVAVLCTIALGKENVISVHMPYGEIDLKKFNSNSIKIANKLGIKKENIPINNIVDLFDLTLSENISSNKPVKNKRGAHSPNLSPLNLGNVKSRIRTMILYSICNSIQGNARVIGTGNLSEDFIGYCTKGGDSLADIFPIGDLYKSEVYAMLDHFVKEGVLEESMVDRIPSAGLWDGQTDEKELGYSYEEMQPVIEDILLNYEEYKDEQLKHGFVLLKSPIHYFVWERHWSNKHKNEGQNIIRIKK